MLMLVNNAFKKASNFIDDTKQKVSDFIEETQQKASSFLRKQKKAIVTVGSAALVGEYIPAHADIATSITDAFTTGQTNVGLAVTGIIAMVAVVTAVGLIIKLLGMR